MLLVVAADGGVATALVLSPRGISHWGVVVAVVAKMEVI